MNTLPKKEILRKLTRQKERWPLGSDMRKAIEQDIKRLQDVWTYAPYNPTGD